ncbi:hypothetical protein ACNQFN_22385 [Thauera butanivorans]|uniref:hypothetical protein n=1 Tax=Thauera butanivorans TaxID=86174 RepID=UPI003AB761EB
MTKTMRPQRRFRRTAQSGAIKPWMLIVLLLALAPLLTLGFYEGRKAYWDAKVREMCAKDGGVKVYETVKLPADRFDQYGNVGIPNRRYARPTDDYFYELETEYLRSGDPSLVRHVGRIFRRSDNKILGESIRYGRGGGDLPGPWHPSSFSCPEISPATDKLESSIFQKGIGR